MAEKLIIPVVLDTSGAKAALRDLQSSAKIQIGTTAKAQQQANQQTTQAARDAAKQQAQAAREAAKAQIQAAKDAAKQAAQASRGAAKQATSEARAAAKEQAQIAKEIAKEQMRIAREAAQSAKDASKLAIAEARQAAKEQAQVAKEAAKEAMAIGRELLAAEKQAAKDASSAKKQAVRDAASVNKELQTAEKQAVKDSVASQKQAAAQKKANDASTFQAWKEKMDAQHRQEMQAWTEKQSANKKTKESFLGQISSVEALGAAFMRLQVFQQIAGVIRQGMEAVGQSIQDARNHIKDMVQEMEAARKGAKELAALRGKSATAGFTASMAREAAAAGVDAEDYKQFSTAYEAYTGQYTGAEGATPKELASQGKKISKDQAVQLQKQVAGYSMGARGLSADDSAQLLGLVISKSKAGASNEDIMSDYAKMMKVAELAPGRTSPMLGQITELGMENVGPQGDMKSVLQAAYLTRVMAQRNPNEAATYGRNLMRGLREIRMDPKKAQELGITKDMDVMQQLGAVNEATKKHVAAGGDQGEFVSKYFKDIREWGAVQTALNEGIEGGGFQRAEQEAAGVDAGTAATETRKYIGSEEGRAATDRSAELAAQRENAGRYVELRHIQSEARKAMLASREVEIPEGMAGAFLTQGGSVMGQGSRAEQVERAEVGRMLREKLSGYEGGRKWLGEHGATVNKNGKIEGVFDRNTPESTMADGANELKRIRELAEKEAEERNKNRNAVVPLVAPMPDPRGRM